MAKPKTSNVDVAGSQDYPSFEIAKRWCADRGEGWQVIDKAGRGGTAPVYGVLTPEGERALKIYDEDFSTGERSRLEPERVQLQVSLGDHSCASLVKIYGGGSFEGRLFVLMSRAPGEELEKVLAQVPREKIRHIVDQVAKAAAFLRKKGICHRDIKSANIFVTDDFETVIRRSTAESIADIRPAPADNFVAALAEALLPYLRDKLMVSRAPADYRSDKPYRKKRPSGSREADLPFEGSAKK